MTATEVCLQWIENGLTAIEVERARLNGPDDHLDDEMRRLSHRACMMKELRKECEHDLAKAKASMAKVEREARARARWGWFAPKAGPDAHGKAQETLKDAEFRFGNAIKMDQDATDAETRERQRVARLRKDAKSNLPNAFAVLDRRAELLRTFRHLVAAEPQIAYGGVRAFQAWVDEDQPLVPVPAPPDDAGHSFPAPRPFD